MAEQQYFQSRPEFNFNFDSIKTMTSASYNDNKLKTIVESKEPEKLFACALQMAVVGFGNKKLGTVTYEDEEIDVKTYLESENIVTFEQSGASIPDDQLTAKRLVRLFRYQIHEYLELTGMETYLYRKYCDEEGNSSYIFPMAEYFITDPHIADQLLETYKNLDARTNSSFFERVCTVFDARGITYTVTEG